MSKIKVNRLENTSTANGGIDIDTSGHVQVDGLQMPTAGPLSNRNLIINGAMNVAQRGTTQNIVGANTGYYTVDRWLFDTSGLEQFSGVVKQQAITDLPGFKTAFRVDTNTTAESAIDADDRMLLYQEIEAQNLQRLKYGTASAQTITCTFWVKASVTGTFGFQLYNSDQNRILGSTYSINAINTWELKTLTFAGDPAGNLNNDNGAGLRWQFTIAAGSNYTGTDNTSWGTYSSPKLCNGHAQNGVITNVGGYWQVTGCQLEVGSKATPFEHRSYGDELERCQRYYIEQNWVMMNFMPNIDYRYIVPGPGKTMRTSPDHAYYHPTTGTENQAREHSSGNSYTINDHANANSNGPASNTYFGINSSASNQYALQAKVTWTAEL